MDYSGTYKNQTGATFTVSRVAASYYLARYAGMTFSKSGADIAALLATGEWSRV